MPARTPPSSAPPRSASPTRCISSAKARVPTARRSRSASRSPLRATPERPRSASRPASSIFRRISGTRPSSSTPTRRQRHRRRRAGRREPERPSHLSLRVQRRTRSACHVERRHRIDAARRHQGDGPGRLPQPFRQRRRRTFPRVPGWPPLQFRVRDRAALTAALEAGGLALYDPHGLDRRRAGDRDGRDPRIRVSRWQPPPARSARCAER